jgi:hypothetical protein
MEGKNMTKQINFFKMVEMFNLSDKEKINIAKRFIEQVVLDIAIYDADTEKIRRLNSAFDSLKSLESIENKSNEFYWGKKPI